jgi:NADH:ubiquinone oxidoreductase subunit F (NADH-binding)
MTAAADTATVPGNAVGVVDPPVDPHAGRLLSALTGPDLAAHHAAREPLPTLPSAPQLLDLVEVSGLTGRGGAGFPTHRKLRAVAAGAERGRRAVVIANGSEGEPASGKDRVLLVHAPHLVLDGIQVAARAVGADQAHLYVPREPLVQEAVRRAVEQRRHERGDVVRVEVVTAPPRFVAGQESAAVARVGGAEALPRLPVPPVFESGHRRRPTLVQNVETLAHLALMVRYGAGWFRSVGTAGQPGTALFTVGGAVAQPGVVEDATGTSLRSLLAAAGGPTGPLSAVLVGGYHGAWVPTPAAYDVTTDQDSLRPWGAAVGAGVVCALPAASCGLVETARVVRYLAGESAQQCGPCMFGLPAIAGGLAELAGPRPRPVAVQQVERWAGMVVGRGACAHPDGTVRLVRSALHVFGPEIELHAAGRCSATSHRPVLPLPDGRRQADWW